MKRRLVTGLLALALVTLSGSLAAQPCRVGQGLGATMLIPYFEVDTANPSGITTLFSVNNEFNGVTAARVVLWTDMGIPTLGFDLFLEPRDLQSINVRDLFNGVVPSTGGSSDLTQIPFCSSPTFTPVHVNPVLTATEIGKLRAAHRGFQDPVTNLCSGAPYKDSIARGYITIDVVDECSGIEYGKRFTPADTDFPYFIDGDGGIGEASNRLWGDFFIVNPGENFAQGSEAVSIWSDPTLFAGPNEFTFYGRFDGFTAQDDRAPLPDLWSSRFLTGGAFSGGTDFIVWRDPGTPEADQFACFGGQPSWFPLNTSFVTARNEAGADPDFITNFPLMALATQRFSADEFDFNYNNGRVQFGFADGPNLQNHRQAWLQTVFSAENRYSLGLNGIPVNSLCNVAP
ncbi:MAG: hypothetical protein AAF604_03505 [Acidobacteriota bacterium]